MILKPHPVYGLPHMVATDLTTSFERCMSDVTLAIGRIERLPADLTDDQRHRLTAAAERLAAALQETAQ